LTSQSDVRGAGTLTISSPFVAFENIEITKTEPKIKSPLTLTLSRRERGLTAVFGRTTPTCDTALNSGSEKQTNRPLTLPERGADRGTWSWNTNDQLAVCRVRNIEITKTEPKIKSPSP
jgi:hypothetical protein